MFISIASVQSCATFAISLTSQYLNACSTRKRISWILESFIDHSTSCACKSFVLRVQLPQLYYSKSGPGFPSILTMVDFKTSINATTHNAALPVVNPGRNSWSAPTMPGQSTRDARHSDNPCPLQDLVCRIEKYRHHMAWSLHHASKLLVTICLCRSKRTHQIQNSARAFNSYLESVIHSFNMCEYEISTEEKII